MLMAASSPLSENLLMNNFRIMKQSLIPVVSLLILTGTAFIGCSSGHGTFTVTNHSNVAQSDAPVVLTRESIVDKSGEIPLLEDMLPVPYSGNEALPSQVDDVDGDGKWDELAFTISIGEQESKRITIRFVTKEEYPVFEPRTNVRFGILEDGTVESVDQLSIPGNELPVPLFTRFQMDGPAWENDKVGFRQYIDGRNGRDLFGKTTSNMALDTVGIAEDGSLEDNYHVMLPWGRDILAVGNSLGLGGLAIVENEEVVRLGVRMDAPHNNVENTIFQLITEGPVRSIFKLTYKGWKAGNSTYDLINTVSIWAGSYGYTNTVQLKSLKTKDTLAVGLVNIHNDKLPTLLDEIEENHVAFYTHDKQTYDDGWHLGMGIIFPKEHYVSFERAPNSGSGVTNSFLNMIELGEEKKFEYLVYAGWELTDPDFADSTYFDAFMQQELQKTARPLTIQ